MSARFHFLMTASTAFVDVRNETPRCMTAWTNLRFPWLSSPHFTGSVRGSTGLRFRIRISRYLLNGSKNIAPFFRSNIQGNLICPIMGSRPCSKPSEKRVAPARKCPIRGWRRYRTLRSPPRRLAQYRKYATAIVWRRRRPNSCSHMARSRTGTCSFESTATISGILNNQEGLAGTVSDSLASLC